MSEHCLHSLLSPRSVAVIGASAREGALGRFVFENMRNNGFQNAYGGILYAVNPKHRNVSGEKCYRAVEDLPTVPDLMVITSPADTVAEILQDAGRVGVKNAVVLSAGFNEIGKEGLLRTRQVQAALARYGIRMIGPNCVGIMRPAIGMNATFANAACKSGPLALISQSGAVCTALLDWAATTEIGFSSVVSLGAALDLDFGEVLDYLVHDSETKSILLYIEGIRDARGFVSALRAAARVKPVVVFKAGRHSAGTKAVTSHTGALAGSDAVFDAALARSGAVRVSSSLQLFAAARILASAKRPAGARLAIVTNANTDTREAVEKSTAPGSGAIIEEPTGLEYPLGVYSPSHIAVPFPVNDPLYGLAPDESEFYGIRLGTLALHGERNALRVSLEQLARIGSNPFYPYLEKRALAWLDSGG